MDTADDRAAPDVFISYRRDDSAAHAGRLYDRLARELGESHVFMDVDSIGFGVDWRRALREAVTRCDVLLAVIGPDWLAAADERGDRRLDDPGDYVRFEIHTALERDVPVVPILVDGAERPPPDALPEDLRQLTSRQELRIDNATFQSDAGRLVAWLRRTFGAGAATGDRVATGGQDTREDDGRGDPRRRLGALAGLALTAAVIAVAVVLLTRPDGDGGGGTMTEREAVERVQDILEFSLLGRQARLDEQWDAAVANREETLERVRAFQEEDPPIERDVELLEAAAEASLAAVEAYRACGAAGCAPEETRAAQRAKQAFLAQFNPRARRYLDREWSPGEF